MKLRQLLLIGFLFITLMSIILIGSLSFVEARNALRQQVSHHLQTAAISRASHINTYLSGLKDRLIDFASDGMIKNCLYDFNNNVEDGCNSEALSEHLIKSKLLIVKDFYEMFVLDVNGKVKGTTNIEEEIGEDFSTDPNFLKGKQSVFVRDITFETEFNFIGMSVSAPVIRNNKFEGVVVARLSPKSLYSILSDKTGLGESGEIYLVNKDGLMISPSRFRKDEDTILKQVVNTKNSRDCIEDMEEYGSSSGEVAEHEDPMGIFPDYRGVSVLGMHSYINEMQWCLLTEMDEVETFASITKLRNQILGIAGIITILVIIFAFYFARLISSPIIKLRDAAIKLGEGKLSTRIKTKSKNEIGDLVKSFNKMASVLEDSEKEITNYTKNLEKTVKQRTAALEKEKEDAEKFSSFATGRELKMIELKKKIKELEKRKR